MNQDNKIGLVLVAVIEVLLILEFSKLWRRGELDPNFISRTSAGAILGVLFAAGISW